MCEKGVLSLEKQIQSCIKEANAAFSKKISTNVQKPVSKTRPKSLKTRLPKPKNPSKKSPNETLDPVANSFTTLFSIPTVPKAAAPERLSCLAVALPGSILNNAQNLKLKTLMIGQIARFCAIFSVDEIVIFDDKDIGYDRIGPTTRSCNLMKKLLQFIEIPQYLRTAFFGMDHDLSYASLLHPLATPHHMKGDEYSKYRNGVTLEQLSPKGFTLANCGLDRDVILDRKLKPNLCVTVRLDGKNSVNGVVVSPDQPRKDGIYWGYSVRVVEDIANVFSDASGKPYSTIIGTSDKGSNLQSENMKFDSRGSLLIVFGGVKGLEFAFENSSRLNKKTCQESFDYYVNCCPGQACRTIRTEEAVPIVLTSLKNKLRFS